jgi:glycosyltransferase involved in cell wall biosynthesis
MALPLGVDTEIFYKNHSSPKVPTIIFTGNMDYKPNIDAVLWFYRNCWNKLKGSIPNIHFIIAGSSPHKEIKGLAKDGSITITGRVPSIADLINGSHISIAPMQSGSGMQFKILESMACGVPVVTTSIGLGDIRALANQEVFVADLPDLFTEIVLMLLQSNNLRDSVGERGLRYIHANHSWCVLNQKIEESILKITKNTTTI